MSDITEIEDINNDSVATKPDNKILNAEFKKITDKIVDSDTKYKNHVMYLLNLETKLCGETLSEYAHCAEYNDIVANMSPELCTTFKTLKTMSKDWILPFDELVKFVKIEAIPHKIPQDMEKTLTTLRKKIDTWIYDGVEVPSNLRYPKLDSDTERLFLTGEALNMTLDYQLACTKTLIALVEKAINLKRETLSKKIDPRLFDDIARDAARLDNIEKATKTPDGHAWELYNDGTIYSTKGDDLYGARSVFKMEHGMVLPHMVFPRQDEPRSYAIVTHDEALSLRNRMISLIIE
jgi:hypothetical protein